MDAQVARMVLSRDTDALAGSQIDALGTYQSTPSVRTRSAAGRSPTTATGSADRALVLEVLQHLANYRERVAAAPGCYTQATNVQHLDLLPAGQRIHEASADGPSTGPSGMTLNGPRRVARGEGK
jgi:hypothetical protein